MCGRLLKWQPAVETTLVINWQLDDLETDLFKLKCYDIFNTNASEIPYYCKYLFLLLRDHCKQYWIYVAIDWSYISQPLKNLVPPGGISIKRWSSFIMTSSNGNIFCITGPLCREFTGHRWIPLTKASDVELWCFLWSGPEQTVE